MLPVTRSLRSFVGVPFLAALFLAGCGGSADQDETGPAPVTAPPPAVDQPPVAPTTTAPFTIAWGSCAIPSGGKSIEAECATVDAPARRGVPGSGTTPVAIYRLKSKKQPATAQMWLLNGGPGGAGFTLAPYAQMVTTLAQGVDAYLIDHRGTGSSSYLDCPRALATSRTNAELAQACSKEIRDAFGDRVDGFSTTESAHDVRELIDSTATPQQKVYVYGGSYGSYWAHRLLQLPNVRVDAVVTDGNCLGDTCTFDAPQAFGVDETMKYILDVCKDTPACKARLGADPWAFAAATLQKVKTGHCSQSALAKYAPADLGMSIGVYFPALLMPVVYRLDRCNAADVAALDKLESRLREFGGGRVVAALPRLGPTPKPDEGESFSNALLMHVIGSEMISRPAPSASALASKAESLTWKVSEDSLDIGYFDKWVGYARDGYVGGWVNRDVPWLMMQGTFDFQTVYSLSTRALEHVKDPALQLVRVDGGGHGVVFDSKCSLEMLESFLANPRAKVDASCVADVKAESLRLDPSYTEYFLGSADPWE